MSCSCKKNYLGESEIPKGHFLVMNFETGHVRLYSKWGRIPHPKEYLARWYDRQYGKEGRPDDPIPAA